MRLQNDVDVDSRGDIVPVDKQRFIETVPDYGDDDGRGNVGFRLIIKTNPDVEYISGGF